MKIQAIVNSRSTTGSDRRLGAYLRFAFGTALLGIERTKSSAQAAAIVRHSLEDGADTFVACGGDGTVNSVLGALAGTDAALGLLPLGAANDLASLHKVPVNLAGACKVILERRLRAMDLIEVNGRYYATGGGTGLPCRAARIANSLKRRNSSCRGWNRAVAERWYLLAALQGVLRPEACRRVRIQWNTGSLVSYPLALLIQNQPFLGKYFYVTPGAANNDGMFDVSLVENPGDRPRTFLTLLRILTGRPDKSAFVRAWRASEIEIESDKPFRFFGDGDPFFKTRRVSVKIAPRALKLIVPESACDATERPTCVPGRSLR